VIFPLLNKSAIWWLCQCVNPSPALYFSPLLHPTHPHAGPRWAARYEGSLLVGRSLVSNFPRYTGVQIHSLGWRTFREVGSTNCIISVSIPRSVIWAGYWIAIYVIFRLHLATRACFVNNHKNLPKPTANTKMEIVTALFVIMLFLKHFWICLAMFMKSHRSYNVNSIIYL